MVKYNLKTRQEDRVSLDTWAFNNGMEDARQDYGQRTLPEGEELREEATSMARLLLYLSEPCEPGQELVDDHGMFVARYVDGYTKGYAQQAASLKADNAEKESIDDASAS